jgi:hypothetical protein
VEIQGAEIGDGLRARAVNWTRCRKMPAPCRPLHDIEKLAGCVRSVRRLPTRGEPADLVLPRDLSHSLCHMTHDALKLLARKPVAGPVRVSVRVADDDPAVLFWR